MNVDKENITDSKKQDTQHVSEDENSVDKDNLKFEKDDRDELDEKITSFGKMLRKSLSGDVLAKDAIKSQAGVILLVAFFIFLCTSNRYSCQQAHIKEAKLKKELSDAKNRAFSSFSLLTEKSRRSKLLEGLKAMNDSSLQIAEQPPFIVDIPQDELNEQTE